MSVEHRRSAARAAAIVVSADLVCCSDGMDSSCNLVGINVPKLRVAKHKEESIMSERIRIAIDLAKSIFQLAISDRPGKVTRKPRLRREELLPFLAQQPLAVVFMEACGTAHYWGRRIEQLGHQVTLLPPHHVRPYVRGNKTDKADAQGILDAGGNEDLTPVPIKTLDQQQLSSIHRLRAGWMAERTRRLNSIRGLLRELGMVIPLGAEKVVPAASGFIQDADAEVPDALRPLLAEACDEVRQLENRIRLAERQLEALAKQIPDVALLRTIPGIGLLTATALVAWIGDARRFRSGRHLSSFLGLTPREFSSGLKRYLGRISKRGDGYLRSLLIQGARAFLVHAPRYKDDRIAEWALRLCRTRHHNKAVTAVANKLARIVWAVWTTGVPYDKLHARGRAA